MGTSPVSLRDLNQAEGDLARTFPMKDPQRVKVIVQKRMSQLNQVIEDNRQRRIKIAGKLMKEAEAEQELAKLMDSLGADGETTMQLKKLQNELKDSMSR